MVGREAESKSLLEAAERNEAQLVVYGRRRVGKTYLVRETFGNRFHFEHSGVAGGSVSSTFPRSKPRWASPAFSRGCSRGGMSPTTFIRTVPRST